MYLKSAALKAEALSITHQDLRLDIAPALGASILGLWHQGRPWLRPSPANPSHAGQTAGYALLPYSNRIADGKLLWQGKTYTLPPNFDQGPHPLHGVGFMHAWTVLAHNPHSLTLGYTHAGDVHWPFAFSATQGFTLQERCLVLDLQIENTDACTQPMGLGWHPYFVRSKDSTLNAKVGKKWLCSADKLPTQLIAHTDLTSKINDLDLDHCFTDWVGRADIVEPGLHLQLNADCSYLVVYTPPGEDFFCVEPVTHSNNAIRQPKPEAHGLRFLAPHERMGLRVTLGEI